MIENPFQKRIPMDGSGNRYQRFFYTTAGRGGDGGHGLVIITVT